jgi:Holliday junction resolvasome RuvABC ATP-dependent DNA helicase subunit
MSADLVNAFTPADEIQDLDRFAGRVDAVRHAATALASRGTHLIVYGPRGVGKSSLARVIERISQSDRDASDRFPFLKDYKFDFLPVAIRIDDSIQNLQDVLIRLVVDDRGLADWIPMNIETKETLYKLTGKANFAVLSGTGETNFKDIEKRQALPNLSAEALFINTLHSLKKSGVVGQGALLIIDEFDKLKDKTGVAAFLKALPSDLGRFVLVGVSDNVPELISEHESLPRQIAEGCIQVGLMPTTELEEIINGAERFLRNTYTFDAEARAKIVQLARGVPYFVHLTGKYALMKAHEAGKKTVDLQCVIDGIDEIALRGTAIHEPAYIKSIGRSYVQEYVLKHFARTDTEEIYTSDVYDAIANSLNIDSGAVSVYVGRLASEERGAVLVKVRDRYYRFTDNLFRTYAALRPFQLKPNARED